MRRAFLPMDPQSWWPRLRETVQEFLNPTSLAVAPGLYTYPVALDGGRRRIHLRVEVNGAGVLFIDVTDVIHLNPTAVQMVSMALKGVPFDQAQARLLRYYRDVSAEELQSSLTEMYSMAHQLRTTTNGCATCAISSLVEYQPIFSTPITAPYKADIALTYRCNNACAHCYNEPDRFPMNSLSVEDWFRVFDQLADIGVPHIILTGGEPTLHSKLTTLIQYADSLGLVVGMNTNGRRLADPDVAAALAGAGLNHVQVTLESCDAATHDAMVGATGAFDETVQGIKNALTAGLHTITNTTLTAHNRDQALAIVRFLHSLGLRTFAMNGMIYAGGGTRTPDAVPVEEMTTILSRVRDEAEALDMRFLWYTVTNYCEFSPVALGLSPKRCNAGEYSMCIEPNGDVLPCQSYYVSAGNILTDAWEDIWQSDLFRSFRYREEDPLAAGLPQACWDCPDLEMCGGGCRLERETRRGVRAAERGCTRTRVSVREGVTTRASGATTKASSVS